MEDHKIRRLNPETGKFETYPPDHDWEKAPRGYIRNCIVEVSSADRWTNTRLFSFDKNGFKIQLYGYAIIPVEKYQHLLKNQKRPRKAKGE